jgi:hypothetical protein
MFIGGEGGQIAALEARGFGGGGEGVGSMDVSTVDSSFLFTL